MMRGKYIKPILMLVLFGLLFAAQTEAKKKGRKLPAGAYIKTAKIEIISGEPERYAYAIIMLDSLFLNYGPHAEGLNWMVKIRIDLLEREADLKKRAILVEELVAYTDSIHQCCDNKEIKKKYRKGCKKFAEDADSNLERFWRDIYNSGVEQKDEIERITDEIDEGIDDETKEFYVGELAQLTDSCIANMKMAMVLDPKDERPSIALGSIYQSQDNLTEAINWYKKGLELSEDRKQLLTAIAYIYIDLDDYCAAIPYFSEYIDLETMDAGTMNNLSICYNNCGMYDSATTIFYRILEFEPDNASANKGLANYHFELAQNARDSSRQYSEKGQEADQKKWEAEKALRYDSARVYQRKVFEIQPDNLEVAERYGMMCYLLSDLEEAAVAFAQATELDPSLADNWAILGDCYIGSSKFDEAAKAYESVSELEPDKLEIWERLSELYLMTGQLKKKAKADKKVAALK